MDEENAEENLKAFKEKVGEDVKVFPISAATNTGLDELLAAVADILKNYPEDIVFEEDYDEYSEYENVAMSLIPILMPSQGYYVVEGVGVER